MADLPALDARIYTKEVLSEGKSILEKHDASGEYKLGLSLIKRKFLEWGVMWLKREPLDHVGTDEVNRGGLGVTGVDGERHGLEFATGDQRRRPQGLGGNGQPASSHAQARNRVQ